MRVYVIGYTMREANGTEYTAWDNVLATSKTEALSKWTVEHAQDNATDPEVDSEYLCVVDY